MIRKLINKIKRFFNIEVKPIQYKEILSPGKVYHRFAFNCKNLKKEDFVLGFGRNSDLINRVHVARLKYNESHPDSKLPLRSDFKEIYDNRIGYYIDMTKIETKFHPYHSKELIDIKTHKRYVIDTINILNDFGKYMILGCRQHGSKSHMHIIWENYTSKEPDTITKAKTNQNRFKMVDRFDAWNFC